MINLWYQRSLITLESLTREALEQLFELAACYKKQKPLLKLSNCLLASCFFEPSTRTRLSFEAAIHRLGGSVIGFADGQSSSQQKGESFRDTIRIISGYVDAIILRHPQAGAAQAAVEAAGEIPIINAGDGAHQHPTQALLDLFTIQETQQRLDNLNIALVGDLKYGRTAHSLIQALTLFRGNHLFLVAPENLALPQTLLAQLQQQGCHYSQYQSLAQVLPQVDILYMTRIQQERFQATETLMPPSITLTTMDLQFMRPQAKVLHPLPRLAEIAPEVDSSPQAYYFQQANNGIYVRQALLSLLMNPNG
ncbi:MAG: aspartate carbamoyltransferase [Candidatus Symbiodolus clandestinus]